jgi:hypothetical protein
MHFLSTEGMRIDISSRRIEPSALRSSGTPPVRTVNVSLRLPDRTRSKCKRGSNLLIYRVVEDDRTSFHVVPLDDAETGDGRGTLRFDICGGEYPVDIDHATVDIDFDETSGRAVIWWKTITHGELRSEYGIVDLV